MPRIEKCLSKSKFCVEYYLPTFTASVSFGILCANTRQKETTSQEITDQWNDLALKSIF